MLWEIYFYSKNNENLLRWLKFWESLYNQIYDGEDKNKITVSVMSRADGRVSAGEPLGRIL